MTAPDLSRVRGRVVRDGDDDYDAARLGWNELFRHRPLAVVYVADVADVIETVAAAREASTPLRIRSGGHCLEGWSSVDDGIVIDVSGLTGVRVDAAASTVTVRSGVTQGQAVAALDGAGVAVATGGEGSVSVVGATLGGGLGLLTRSLGLACDSLIAADIVVVDADGRVEMITVDVDRHPSLLWALRGAGNGSFGVVTSLTYSTQPLPHVGMVTARWKGLDHLPEIFGAWQRTAPFTDRRLTSQLEVQRDGVTLVAVMVGGSAASAEELLREVLAVGVPAVELRTGAWSQAYETLQIPLEEEPANWRFVSHFAREPFDTEAIETIRSFMAAAPTAACNYFANAFGGAVATAPAGGSAFAHRDALFYAEPGAGWGARGSAAGDADPLTEACLAWVADFGAALHPHVAGAYANVPDGSRADWQRAYWGDHVDALRAVKSTYDPLDAFSFEQSVPPPERSVTS